MRTPTDQITAQSHPQRWRKMYDRVTAKAKELGLSFGYLGNIESWGDNRTYFIWMKELRDERASRTPSLWSCEAQGCTVADLQQAYAAMVAFEWGLKVAAHRATTDTTRKPIKPRGNGVLDKLQAELWNEHGIRSYRNGTRLVVVDGEHGLRDVCEAHGGVVTALQPTVMEAYRQTV